MTEPSKGTLAYASRVIGKETASAATSAEVAHGIERAFARAEALLITLVGANGFRALLDRAAHSIEKEFPYLSTASIESKAVVLIRRPPASPDVPGKGKVKASIFIHSLEAAVEERGAARVKLGAAQLLARVIQLLCSFIGEELTFRLLQRVWKDVSTSESGSGSEEA
jgi:hypothetical protein